MKLSQQQQALLEKLLREEGLSVNDKPVAGRRDGLNQYPLSYAQRRLWFLDQLEPGQALYNMPVAVRLVGEADERVLSQVVNEVVRRHEVLRTTFTTIDGMPVQRIAPEREIFLPVEDLTDLPEEVRERRAQELAQAEARMPFDLTAGPLLRVRLLRLTATEHIVLFTMHHIVADGWSMGVLVQEVAALYRAYVQQQPSPLPELPMQYADFADWQRQWLSGPILQRQLTYWTEHLAGVPAILNLPTDRPRPSAQRYRGATHSFTVAASTVMGLYQVGRQAQATLFMTLAAALNVLMARYSGQNDICLGTPIANRTRAELEPLIGFFVNTLVLRTRIDSSQPFFTLLEQVRTTALNAYAHQDIPFEYVVEVLNPERQLSHTPLFQVMLILQNAPMEKLELPGLTLSSMQIESTTAQFDLTVDLVEANGQLYGTVGYNKDLFEAATIERLANHYIRLLEAIVAEPTVRVRDVAMLSTAERAQLLLDWNATATDSPVMQTIQELFEAQVERTPEALAVVCEDQHLTYRELNARANQLARYLCATGVGPDALVGLCVERSLQMIVGVMGILKAGGAYVPLDPTYPMERLRYVLADSRPVVLLTQASLCAMLPVTEIPTLCLDTQWGAVATEPTDNLLHQPLPQHLAYVIYTSGSTGNAKGVVVTHGNVVHATMARLITYREGLSSFLLLSSVAFDSSVAGMFGTLSQGGQLVLPAAGEGLEPGILWELIGQRRITQLLTVPSFYRLLLEQMPVTKGHRLRSVILAGEECGSDLLVKHRSLLPGVKFFNEYGPTEATVWSTVHEGRDGESTPTVPIGRPIANTQLYILDGDLEPVPVGVAGELYIAGAGLARGYLRRPDLTAEKFIPNPFDAEPGARMYKTGDLARYLSDGNIEYLGRLDHQVKIRGFRIELGEIEAALQVLPGVREAVVLVREDNLGDKRLVAYVVAKSETEPMETGALRSRLAQTLPAYMVPVAFVVLEQLPLTPNGKVDRKALPPPESTRGTLGYVAPRTPVEAKLAEVWADVLQVDKVGVEDNFFELGGHSLLATRLLTQVRTAFHVEVPLRAVFEAPTVAEFARILEQVRQEQTGVLSGPALVPIGRGAVLSLSYAQQRLWFLDQLEPGQAFYNIGGNVRLEGELDVPVLTRTFNEIVRRHEILRTTITTVDGVPAQQIAPELTVAVPLVDLSDLPEKEREHRAKTLAFEEAQAPFDLETGALLRIQVLRLAPRQHILLFTLHHIVADGWSMNVLVQEVAALYSAFVQQRPSPLPELAIQYADYAAWQRQWLSGPLLQQQLTYWTEHLAGAPTVLNLPTDRPRPSVQRYRGATHSFIVAASTVTGLYQVGLQAQATLFMTLAAALNVLLARYSGQEDICIGTPIANRTRAELEPLIGFFVNTIVLRTRVDHTQSFLRLLEQVRMTALKAYAHQDLPFEHLVETLNPERQMSHAPLFQIMLVLQNAPMEGLQLPGLTLSSVPVESTTAKFDLTLDLMEAEGRLYGTVEYNTDLFDATTMERLIHHYMRLLEAIGADPSIRVGELAMLSPAERHQLLVEWNMTVTESPHTQTIQEMFEVQAARTPEAVAVVHEGNALTYGELNARANQVARHLRTVGVGPDVLVGLCLERSLDMVVSVLGILKAGGAYVPLDPSYPADRLAYMLADSQPEVLLTHADLLHTLPATKIPTLCLDTQWATVATEAMDDLPHQTLPQHLAYVIYTSGSTGRPKGVAITHHSVVAFIHWACTVYDMEDLQGVLASTSIYFDLSVFELFVTLCGGGQVILSENALALSALVNAKDVTLINTVPSAIRELLRQNAIPNSVRTVNLAGEPLQPAVVDQLYALGTVQRVFDLYGPSEDTTYSTYVLRRLQGPATIGRPIARTQIYILDNALEPVPVGVAGELHIAGSGLARGYLGRPGLTAEKFIPNPFSAEPGERMYKSGDLARYLSDGNIEYLGRIDHQVKIRGFRIELGEIEAALQAVPGVREAVVLAREDNPGDKRLVAYVVTKFGMEARALRSSLAQTLPEYMVPAAFIFLEQLPLTPNGKVNRKALPVPDLTRGALGYVAPQTLVETQLVGIWTEILTLDRVGVEDNFFDLGGHSLLATRLLTQVRAAFHVEVPLRAVFEAPTISGLARLIEAIREGRPMPQHPPIDLAAEAVLPADVMPTWVNQETIEQAIHPAHVFLTGATGFLGAYLLRDLLEITRASIHCLVRASGTREGRAKLRRNLETYGLWKDSYQTRIEVCIGDLSRPLLGFSSAEFDRLAAVTDVIYHNGARLDFTQPYLGLKAENVLGTAEVLRLASRGTAKPVHYVSTVSVFDSGNLPEGRLIREDDEIGPSVELQGGYSQSKWVAERLVQLAGRRGLPVSIYRPGIVSGDSRTGAWKTDDFVCRMIKGCILLGKVPDIVHEVNLVPVDYVSRAIVTLSFNRYSVGKAFHLVNPHPGSLDEFVAHIRSRGYPLEVVPEQQWRTEVISTAMRDTTNPLTPFLSHFESAGESEPAPSQDGVRFDCQNVLDGLKDTTVVCPPVDATLIDIYFQYFAASGFLPALKTACGHD